MRAWLVLHVLAAIGGIGPEIAFGMMGPRARRQPGTAAVYDAIAAARARIVYPFIALQIVSGSALIVVAHHSVRREEWLLVALVLYAVAVALVAAVLAPGSAQARRALARDVRPDDPELRPLWKRQAAAGGVAGTLLVTVAVLMVWKPSL